MKSLKRERIVELRKKQETLKEKEKKLLAEPQQGCKHKIIIETKELSRGFICKNF